MEYEFDEHDVSLLAAAAVLLNKVATAKSLRFAELVSVAKLQHVFSRLPKMTPGLDVSVSVTSPRRKFGEIETYHWWDVAIEDERLSISCAGHFYTPSTGGDTFTTMSWAIVPGEPADFADYSETLAIVPDVQSFPDAVTNVDFGGGYRAEITDPDNPLLEEPEDSDEESEAEADASLQEESEETEADESIWQSVKTQEVDGPHENRVRTRNVGYRPYLDLLTTASGPRSFETVLDVGVGTEIALLLVDQTDFAYQLAERKPFELRLKLGAVRTNAGPIVFLLWWVPPLTDGMPFALYEQLLNPTERGVLTMLRQVSTQTHLHVLLVGPQQKLLDVYEFENTFDLDSLFPIVESSLQGPALNFDAARSQYEKTYNLRTIFELAPGDGVYVSGLPECDELSKPQRIAPQLKEELYTPRSFAQEQDLIYDEEALDRLANLKKAQDDGLFDLEFDKMFPDSQTSETSRRQDQHAPKKQVLHPAAATALGDISPELLKVQLKTALVRVLDDYGQAGEELLRRAELPDLQNLDDVLERVNALSPVDLANELVLANPDLDLKRLPYLPPLEPLKAVLAMYLNLER